MSSPLIFVLDVPKGECADFAALARAVATRLEESGCVRPSWRNAVIFREERFPTGLPFEPPAAIPHADREHTLRDAFVLARLERPLAFGAMGDSDAAPLEVRLVVFIVAGKNASQVEALERLLSILGDGARRERLEAGSAENARRSFEAMLEQLATLTTAPDKPPHPRKPGQT
ncbi:PTS sugar transporter subunit IIA [Dermabacter sp. HMSC08H10]|uniref:PTS sugar transporter subunit IIA n=1 Tax=Dermabacter sp. HMSC08H10 TaxID=1581144 RepID=UPI000A613B5B|nr:PTS sugar transporter subunit IIA [Dermabacter sp. HMSC08H10]